MNKKYLWIFITLVAVYATLALTLPSDPELLKRLDISQGRAHLLSLTFIAPLCIVYFAALYGFLRFRAYAHSIHKTKEGEPFMNISTGLMVLAFSLPIAAILGSLLNYIELTSPDLVAAGTIIRNFIGLLFSFVVFSYIARGAKGLLLTLKDKKTKDYPMLSLAGPIFLASMFTWLITSQPRGTVSDPVYHMPNFLVLLTLAIPYVYIWCIGIKAAYHLHVYKDRVPGVLYKRAIDYLAKGTVVVIGLSILLQIFMTLSEKLNRLDLTPLLLVIYVLVSLYALGYGLVARSAKKLKQIEEV